MSEEFRWRKSAPKDLSDDIPVAKQRKEVRKRHRRGSDTSASYAKELDTQEEEFHKRQSRLRTKIRLRDNRYTAVDLLAKNTIIMCGDDQSIGGFDDINFELLAESESPYVLISGLSPAKLAELIEKVNLEDNSNSDYWVAVVTVARHFIDLHKRRDIESVVSNDIAMLLSGKSISELNRLERDIDLMMGRKDMLLDMDFWASIKQSLHMYKLRKFLSEYHSKCLAKGGVSLSSLESCSDDMLLSRAKARESMMKNSVIAPVKSVEPQRKYEDGEEDFTGVVDLQGTPATGLKPQYSCRVRSEVEWNHYNYSHYDEDSPPPKTVCGYKFHILYPHLLDPSVTPSYKVSPDPADDKHAILRFSAGEPYQDIGFRIVNGAWESSHKKGFVCRFDRGVLYLYFEYKKFAYKR